MYRLKEVTAYLDALLRIETWKDSPGAQNGLQLENTGEVKKIAAAVDACEAVIDRAVQEGASLLIVHHGLFWNGAVPWVGTTYRKLHVSISGNLAIYSAHLPLDGHPKYGNNVLLAQACGFTKHEPFLEVSGSVVGVRVEVEMSRPDLLKRVEMAVGGSVHLAPGGPEICRHIGVVTGAAGSQVAQAAAEGLDTFITGEGSHWTYYAAEETGINLVYAGHYATETFGVKALAKHISERLNVPWVFIDHPSGR